jgi:Mycothiol maleylpyruvate isomerase N-terminal domain
VFGGDAGGGFLAEAYVAPEGGQVFVAGLGLQLRCAAPGGGQVPQRGVAQLVQRPAAAVQDLLASLDDADWGSPTPCPGWSVLDVSCHLVGDDLSLLARQRDSHY